MEADRLEQFIEESDKRFRELSARIDGLALVVLAMGQDMDHTRVIAHLRNTRVFAMNAHLPKATIEQIDRMIGEWSPTSKQGRSG